MSSRNDYVHVAVAVNDHVNVNVNDHVNDRGKARTTSNR